MRKTQFTWVDKTVWLSQKEMALLFGVSTDNIGRHISTILKNELDSSTTEESSATQKEGELDKNTSMQKIHKSQNESNPK